METKEIPPPIALSADDPFIKYLGYLYNSGVNYMIQAEKMLSDIDNYKTNLDGYMKYTKLQFMLEDKK